MALSNTSRRLAKRDLPQAEKGNLIEQVSRARSRLDDIARRVRRPEDLKAYNELWHDRQYAETLVPEPASSNGKALTYEPGMDVRHTSFGDGIVQGVQSDGNDSLITVQFADGTQKTFAASLVADKLIPC
jgi:hypothetical protein